MCECCSLLEFVVRELVREREREKERRVRCKHQATTAPLTCWRCGNNAIVSGQSCQ